MGRAPEAVAVLDPARSGDAGLIEHLTHLVNEVYRAAESGLWRDGVTRTSSGEIAEMISAGQLAVTVRAGRIVGTVQIHDVGPDVAELGMLAADPEHRNTGVGRILAEYAEANARARGMRAMQLELLVPRGWQHPAKEFLRAWYGHRGYRVVRTDAVEESRPNLGPLLATACDFDVYEKPLLPTAAAGAAARFPG